MLSQIGHLTLGLILFFSLFSQAQSSSGGEWAKRAQARESKRWTLQEWLDQKNRNALMDQWLSMNSPSPYEFSLQADSFQVEYKEGTNASMKKKSSQGSVQAFAGPVGISGLYENSWNEKLSQSTGLLQFRLLGSSLQSTSLTVGLGQRNRRFVYQSNEHEIRNLVGHARVQLYLTRHFGVQGTYQYFAHTKDTNLGDTYGHLSEGGLFLDFKGLRIYSDYFEDIFRLKPAGVDSKYRRQGVKTGLQIFF
ncbi:MAG: hypothetical protein ACK5V3_15970 [Bdellovibrionales bacterium]